MATGEYSIELIEDDGTPTTVRVFDFELGHVIVALIREGSIVQGIKKIEGAQPRPQDLAL